MITKKLIAICLVIGIPASQACAALLSYSFAHQFLSLDQFWGLMKVIFPAFGAYLGMVVAFTRNNLHSWPPGFDREVIFLGWLLPLGGLVTMAFGVPLVVDIAAEGGFSNADGEFDDQKLASLETHVALVVATALGLLMPFLSDFFETPQESEAPARKLGPAGRIKRKSASPASRKAGPDRGRLPRK